MDLQSELIALFQIIVIDVVLAGDNAIVVGMAASRVAPELRAKVIKDTGLVTGWIREALLNICREEA